MAQLREATVHTLANPGSIPKSHVKKQDVMLLIYHPRAPTTREDTGELSRNLKASYPGVYNTAKTTETLPRRQGRGRKVTPRNCLLTSTHTYHLPGGMLLGSTAHLRSISALPQNLHLGLSIKNLRTDY